VIKTPVYDSASYEGMATFTPLADLARSNVVDAILYLKRATFVTGETLHIDGGRAA
jgi:NAD(P)-dependent dehydrogenase (short-subunit alcohol dehydrogenase family)